MHSFFGILTATFYALAIGVGYVTVLREGSVWSFVFGFIPITVSAALSVFFWWKGREEIAQGRIYDLRREEIRREWMAVIMAHPRQRREGKANWLKEGF